MWWTLRGGYRTACRRRLERRLWNRVSEGTERRLWWNRISVNPKPEARSPKPHTSNPRLRGGAVDGGSRCFSVLHRMCGTRYLLWWTVLWWTVLAVVDRTCCGGPYFSVWLLWWTVLWWTVLAVVDRTCLWWTVL